MAANVKTRPLLYNKNNKIVVKLNNVTLAKEMKKQASKKVTHRIDAYLVKNNITATKLCVTQTLPNSDIVIQTTNEEKPKKLRRKDD